MEQFNGLGKVLFFVGAAIMLLGVILILLPKTPFSLGKLPGDIFIERKNVSFYFPVVTSILVSILISLVLYFIRKIS